MVSLTEKAAKKVIEIQSADNIPGTLRLLVRGGGCSGFVYDMYFDEKKTFDFSFEAYGVPFFVDQMSLMYLRGTTVDFVETLQAAGFRFDNPGVKTTCGCGASFA